MRYSCDIHAISMLYLCAIDSAFVGYFRIILQYCSPWGRRIRDGQKQNEDENEEEAA